MKKVNSLDFLNKKTFETNIFDFNGNVVINSGEKITPEIILKLYFKNIFIPDSINEEILDTKKLTETVEKIKTANETEEQTVSDLESTPEDEIEKETISEEELTQEKETQKQTVSDSELTPETQTKTPVPSNFDFSEKTEAETEIKNEKPTKTPQFAGFNFEEEAKTETSQKGPMASKFAIDDEIISEIKPDNTSNQEQEQQKEQEKPAEPLFLEFNKEQAERIVKKSLQLGKMFNYTGEELKKLEQAAYYCNIGLTKFKKEDLGKPGFDQKKAYASYEIVTNEMNLADDIANTIKCHIDDYDTTAFLLNSQIPRQHIIGIVCYYENMLMQNKTKEEIFSKMLQLGGNKFNIFVLHKFIRIMRELND